MLWNVGMQMRRSATPALTPKQLPTGNPPPPATTSTTITTTSVAAAAAAKPLHCSMRPFTPSSRKIIISESGKLRIHYAQFQVPTRSILVIQIRTRIHYWVNDRDTNAPPYTLFLVFKLRKSLVPSKGPFVRRWVPSAGHQTPQQRL